MADTMNDTRTPSEILADAVKLAEKTGHSYITISNPCAERIIELLEDEEELGEELGNAVELIRKKDERIKKLLKEQEPKTGHWLKKMSSCPSAIAMGGSKISACDLCGGWGKKTFKYCPHCGAKMEKQP